MADAHRGSSAPLNIWDDLTQNPAAFSFFQAIRLVRFHVENDLGHKSGDFYSNFLRIRPELSLAFPGTDITKLDEIAEEEDESSDATLLYRIEATFLGLYGSSSPLPTFYTEDLLDQDSDDISVVRDFIDIVNYPLFPLVIQGWTRFRPYIKVIDEENERYLELLYCLLGLGFPELRRNLPNTYQLLRYIGLFTQWPRSALGLKTVVADALGISTVDIEPCIARRVKIPEDQRFVLGETNNMLGDECYLGEEVEDRLGKFKLIVGPMDEEVYHSCLPQSKNYIWLEELVTLYVSQPLECDLKLVLSSEEARHPCLGQEKWGALGYDCWLYSTDIPVVSEAEFPLQTFNV